MGDAGGALIFTWSLIALAAIDLDHQLLPDSITLPLLWLGLARSACATQAAQTSLSFPVDPRSSIIGAVAGYLSLWSVYQLFRLLTGKEGMGYGDFKLFAAFGAWFGWQMLLLIILFAAVTGAVVGIALIVAAPPRAGRADSVRPLPRRGGLDRADVGPADRRNVPGRLVKMAGVARNVMRVGLTGGIASGKSDGRAAVRHSRRARHRY